ncbi:MAG: hypothetical protein ACHQIM_08540 [Sphingobacteriales bacterium]
MSLRGVRQPQGWRRRGNLVANALAPMHERLPVSDGIALRL